MPVRNVVRYKSPNTYYHVYNRGHNKDRIFIDDQDYEYFTFLLQRCFGPKQLKSPDGRLYPWFGDLISLNAFCLMPNHFHLLLLQGEDTSSLSRSIQSLATTYSMYFNAKYKRRGSIFESAFKAAPVLNESYLQHITRYIHLNPTDYQNWRYSSYIDYLSTDDRTWINCTPVLKIFESIDEYKSFVVDYVGLRDEIDSLKYELADHAQSF